MSEPIDPRDTIFENIDPGENLVYHLTPVRTATRQEIEDAIAKLSMPGMERREDDE